MVDKDREHLQTPRQVRQLVVRATCQKLPLWSLRQHPLPDTVQGTYQFNDVQYTLGTMNKHKETYPNDETSRHKQNLEAFKAWKLKEGYED